MMNALFKNPVIIWRTAALLAFLPIAKSFSTGAIQTVCENAVPGHGTSKNDSMPFYMNVTQADSENILVTLWASDGPFRGFFLQVMPSDPNVTVQGEFIILPNDTKLMCNDHAVTHTTSDDKMQLLFTWKKQSGFVGDVYFMASFVTQRTESYKLITSNLNTPVTSTTTVIPGSISLDPECGVTKGCYPVCTGSMCSYLITWQRFVNHVTFEMQADLNLLRSFDNKYQAIGLSSDTSMGDDSVLVCKLSGGNGEVESGFNAGTRYDPLGVSPACVSNVTSRVDGSVLICVFDRDINCSNSQVYSLSQSWYLLHASGDVLGGSIQYHTYRAFSESAVDFLSIQLVQGKEEDDSLVKLHGSLMIIAWMLFSSIGIITARHFKQEWKDKTLMGQKIWFQVHRTCMILVLVCTVTAFIVIFVDVEGYREVEVNDDRKYLKSHPILGIVVTALTVINPILSLFRCPPTDDKRPLFNISHFIIGTGAHVVSVLTVIFGMNLDRAGAPIEATYIMYAYIATFIVMEITLELLKCHSQQTVANDSVMELRDIHSKEMINIRSIEFDKKKMLQKSGLLYVHIGLMLCFTVALVVLIVRTEK